MLDAIRSLFPHAESAHDRGDRGDRGGAEAAGVNPLHLAACTLLLDIAWADGEFTAPERRHLEDALARHFGLSGEDGARLLALAESERAKAVDYFHFTSQLQQGYDLGQKMLLAEVMWGLVLADGTISDHERYLTRKIANLLDLAPAYLSTARANAEARAGDEG